MAASILSKDSKIHDLQMEQRDLLVVANLVAPSSQDANVISFSGLLAARVITVDVKEPIKSVQKIRVINRATGAHVVHSSLTISGNTVSVTVDATGITSACIELSYKA